MTTLTKKWPNWATWIALAVAIIAAAYAMTGCSDDPDRQRQVYAQPAVQQAPVTQAPAQPAPQVIVQQAPQQSSTGDVLLGGVAGAALGYMAGRSNSHPEPARTETRVVERTVYRTVPAPAAPQPVTAPKAVAVAPPKPAYVVPPAPKPVAAPAPKPTYVSPPAPRPSPPPAPSYARPSPAPSPSRR